MRRLVVDAQVFHTPALHRGMGKYSLELLDALLRRNKADPTWDSVELIVSSRMPMSQEARDLLGRKARDAQITRLPLRKDIIYSARSVMKHNRRIIDEYVSTLRKSNPVLDIDFFILSPLQGGISSVFPSDGTVHRSLICYDLIPYMFHTAYFRNPIARIENLTKLTEFLKADTFLAISQTVGNDLSVHLGVDPNRIKNIDGGPINHSTKLVTYPAPKPFILMPTGNDLRKNNRTGVLGFNEFNKAHSNRYHLVVTSSFDPEQVRELSALANNVVFTGNISGDELNYLYENCEALLFPSEYEGLGLPVLEAVQKYRPVACSDIAVFREMSKTAFSYFDPGYGTSVAKALEATVGSKVDGKEYAKVLAKYDWERSARLMVEAFQAAKLGTTNVKPRVIVFTQNPETNSDLARMVQSSHAALSRHFDVSYGVAGEVSAHAPRPNLLDFTEGPLSLNSDRPVIGTGDRMPIYYFHDTTDYAKILFTALARPGIAVLTELSLERVWNAMIDRGLVVHERLELERRLQAEYGDKRSALLCSVLANQKAIGVFSEYAKKVVTASLGAMQLDIPVHVLSFPAGSLVYKDTMPIKEAMMSELGSTETGQATELFASFTSKTVQRNIIIRPDDIAPAVDIEINAMRSDLSFEDALSRASYVFAPDEPAIPALYAAMRYGTLPLCYGGEAWAITLPEGTADVKTAAELHSAINTHAPHSASYAGIQQSLMDQLARDHSFARYAQQLNDLVQAAGGTA